MISKKNTRHVNRQLRRALDAQSLSWCSQPFEQAKKDGVQSPIATPLKPHHILYKPICAVVLDGGAIVHPFFHLQPVPAAVRAGGCRNTPCGNVWNTAYP